MSAVPQPATTPSSLALLLEIDAVCDAFEADLRAGRQPSIEEYLAKVDARLRPALTRELLRVEIAFRLERGDTLLDADFKPRFPKEASLIDALLARPRMAELPPELSEAGRFRIDGFIAGGGMGDVFRVHDPDFDRALAVKVLKKEYRHSRNMIHRFLEEAQITGQLQHPGIPPVHEIGRLADGSPFLAMKLIEGRTLDSLLRERKSAAEDLPRFLTIFEQVCQTLGYAHSRGVIHRDMKPANVMVGVFGEVQVMDWGLTKARTPPNESHDLAGRSEAAPSEEPDVETLLEQTQRGMVLGTLAFMPPEQARGDVDLVEERSDVFGLGALLCVILTGQPPYRGQSRQELRRQAASADLADAHARLEACGADAELVNLARQSLAAEMADRPPNAGALAEAVAAYQVGVQQRLRLAEVERAAAEVKAEEERARRKWTLRWVSMVLFVVLLGLVTTYWQYFNAEERRKQADSLAVEKDDLATKKSKLAEDYRIVAGEKADLATKNLGLAKEEAKQRRGVQLELARLAVQEGLNLCENQGDCARGLPCLAYGLQLAETIGEPDLSHAVRVNLSSWSRNLIPQRAVLVLENSPTGHDIALSPDGRMVATACGDGVVRLWDTATGKLLGKPLGTSRQPGRLPSEDRHGGGLSEAPLDVDPVFRIAFSPDGRWIADGSLRGRVRLWEISSGRLLRELQHHDGSHDKALISSRGAILTNNGIMALAFRPDGKMLMAAGKGGMIRLWDPATGKRLTDLNNPGDVNWAVFSPNGESLLVGCVLNNPKGVPIGGVAVLWDTTTGKPRYNPLRQVGPVSSIAFSPDGRLFATGCYYTMGDRSVGEAQLWDTGTGKQIGDPSRFQHMVVVVAFNPDGRHWLAADSEGTVRLFDREIGLRFEGRFAGAGVSGSASRTMDRDGAKIVTAAFSPDGQTFVTVGDGIQAWHIAGMAIGETLKLHRSTVHRVAFSSDGRTLVTSGRDGTTRLWEAPTSRAPSGRSFNFGTTVSQLVFSRDGRRLLVGTYGRGAVLRDQTGRKPPLNLSPGSAVPVVDLSPDGHLALTVGFDHTARLWDAATGVQIGEMTGIDRVLAAAFSPDGKTAAVAGAPFNPEGGGVYLWDVPSRQPRKPRLLKGKSAWAIAFSPDSQTLAAAEGVTVHLFKTADGASTGIPLKHNDRVEIVAFSPDGALLLTAGASSHARLWHATTGHVLHDLRHRKGLVAATFSEDGHKVLTASLDGTAQLWRTATGEPAGPPLLHRQPVSAAALGRDGRTVVTGCADGTVRVWDALTGLPLCPPSVSEREVRCAALSPDGRTAVWGGSRPGVGFRSVPGPAAGTPERIRLSAEALTGFTRDADQAVRWLEVERWQEARRSMGYPGDGLLAIEDVSSWHRREAEEGELMELWFPAQCHLHRLINEQPEDGELVRRCGLALARLGSWDRAVPMLTRAIAQGADSPEVRLERGKAYLQLDRRHDAEKDFTAGLAKWPGAWALWRARGSLRAEVGRWREAADDLRRTTELPGAPISAAAQHALACLRLGDMAGYHAACDGLLRRLERDESTNELIPDTAEVVWPCCLSPGSGVEPERLRQLAEKAAASSSGGGMQNYPLVRALGASLYRAGAPANAVHILGRAVALNNQAPTVWLLLAMSYHQLGNTKEAHRALDAARAWMSQSRQHERLARRVGWAAGIAAAPWGPAPLGASAAFQGFPLGEAGKSNSGVRLWRQLPWPEQVALELLRSEAERLLAGKQSAK
jgi:WD40 repeat protein/tetratricopeptide (TPR) repeat protein/tRNA A-37 threonylcarbamoyl transferase component Bud32